jgi:O-antigen/teichoic acid export membrane protein
MSTPETASPRPPGHLIVLGAIAVVAAAGLLVARDVIAGVVGYVLSTFVALTCITAFRWLDNRRRQDVSYVSTPRLARFATVTAAVALVVAAAHVWHLATELAS